MNYETYCEMEQYLEGKTLKVCELNKYVGTFGFTTDVYENYNLLGVLEEGSIAWSYFFNDFEPAEFEINVDFEIIEYADHVDFRDIDLLDSMIKIIKVEMI